jgi:hypothetical protein
LRVAPGDLLVEDLQVGALRVDQPLTIVLNLAHQSGFLSPLGFSGPPRVTPSSDGTTLARFSGTVPEGADAE